MKITEAGRVDFDELMLFYDEMCQFLGEKDFLPEGNKGGFPSEEMVMDAIKNQQQYLCRKDGQIAAAYIMNHDYDPAYRQAKWKIEALPEEAVVLHALRVLPKYSGSGYARLLVEHAIRTAKEKGYRSIRLDCIVGNEIPVRMYQSYGFEYIDTVDITYPDIGKPMQFRLYELVLD